ncbi:hypothetical protein PAPYR_3851 [Paratrimastix pyriformis]|uniref:Uncharacterized protein n=1 Tax=Paratrimastix pyriformis TaxID=342808 RepID=A0ABQ8ULR5_9EUKA|nr:hypothetical protein PAPYR_3851 [Paratrimastix pyriformis]
MRLAYLILFGAFFCEILADQTPGWHHKSAFTCAKALHECRGRCRNDTTCLDRCRENLRKCYLDRGLAPPPESQQQLTPAAPSPAQSSTGGSWVPKTRKGLAPLQAILTDGAPGMAPLEPMDPSVGDPIQQVAPTAPPEYLQGCYQPQQMYQPPQQQPYLPQPATLPGVPVVDTFQVRV